MCHYLIRVLATHITTFFATSLQFHETSPHIIQILFKSCNKLLFKSYNPSLIFAPSSFVTSTPALHQTSTLKIEINLPSSEQICLASCRASTTVCRARCRVAPSSHTWACFIHWSWSEEAPALSLCVRCCVVFVLLRCVLCLQSSFGSSLSWLFHNCSKERKKSRLPYEALEGKKVIQPRYS